MTLSESMQMKERKGTKKEMKGQITGRKQIEGQGPAVQFPTMPVLHFLKMPLGFAKL